MYRDLWRLMDGAGVDVLLVGHNHIYHRWAAGCRGNRDANGIRQFTVGTGTLALPAREEATSAEPRRRAEQGVRRLHLTLREDRYDFGWVGLPTDPVFHDEGSFACR